MDNFQEYKLQQENEQQKKEIEELRKSLQITKDEYAILTKIFSDEYVKRKNLEARNEILESLINQLKESEDK